MLVLSVLPEKKLVKQLTAVVTRQSLKQLLWKLL